MSPARGVPAGAAHDVPDAGDIVWLEFSPQAGHEQAGHRPALVLSPASYNGRTGLLLCCPLTTQLKGYPFEVAVGGPGTGLTAPSAVLSDQLKSLDWRARRAQRRGVASAAVLAQVRARAAALLGLPLAAAQT